MYYSIDHTVLQCEFRVHDPLREFDMHELLNHAWAGKTHQRSWFGEGDIAEHSETGGFTASGRGCYQAKIRDLCLSPVCKGSRGLWHLHKRNTNILHSFTAPVRG